MCQIREVSNKRKCRKWQARVSDKRTCQMRKWSTKECVRQKGVEHEKVPDKRMLDEIKYQTIESIRPEKIFSKKMYQIKISIKRKC